MENVKKKVSFSGAQPSGILTLGNYLGAIKNWVALQEEHECYYCVVDMHAITVRQDPALLRKRCVETMAVMIACGVDPEKHTLFMQSHVSAHAELAWVLNCFTYMGELSRMTQYKDKSGKQGETINAGLFTYPALMAADILLYQTDVVPIGEDQKQHLELSRDIAERFNNVYSPTFVVPEPFIPKMGARVMSLMEPEKKMSKSDENPNAYISILDDADTIIKKFKRAVTDSDGEIRYDKAAKPGLANLLDIYATCTNCSIDEAVKNFEGKGYGKVKQGVADAVVSVLEPVQMRYKQILGDKAYCSEVITNGAQKAAITARKTLSKVYRKIGFAPCEL